MDAPKDRSFKIGKFYVVGPALGDLSLGTKSKNVSLINK